MGSDHGGYDLKEQLAGWLTGLGHNVTDVGTHSKEAVDYPVFAAAEAVAFGDGLNDREMLQGVGLGIAMGNGHPELKAIADRVAPALADHGVARMLAELGYAPPAAS